MEKSIFLRKKCHLPDDVINVIPVIYNIREQLIDFQMNFLLLNLDYKHVNICGKAFKAQEI